ncbi:hypothetical protein L1887_18492 [Cichorium endivia]|nr:hypothetical protein L1887_18492 [Cichorium endivia]
MPYLAYDANLVYKIVVYFCVETGHLFYRDHRFDGKGSSVNNIESTMTNEVLLRESVGGFIELDYAEPFCTNVRQSKSFYLICISLWLKVRHRCNRQFECLSGPKLLTISATYRAVKVKHLLELQVKDANRALTAMSASSALRRDCDKLGGGGGEAGGEDLSDGDSREMGLEIREARN